MACQMNHRSRFLAHLPLILLLAVGCAGEPSPRPDHTPSQAPSEVVLAFNDSGQRLGSGRSWDVAFGDLDGDGDLDAFIANGSQDGSGNAAWLNDGQANFTLSQQALGNGTAVALGDLDGDGDLDAFITGYDGISQVWTNDGAGVFTASRDPVETRGGFELALGDLDGDGDLDAVIARLEHNTVLLNDGEGEFIDSGQRLGHAISAAIALADLDGDGDLDVLFAGWEEPAQVWLNDGSGNFLDEGIRLSDALVHVHALALGDLNSDAHLDAFMAVASAHPSKAWYGQGDGSFVESEQGLDARFGHGVDLGDLDGDGDLDAVTAHGGPVRFAVTWLNDGEGRFADSGIALSDDYSASVALGDLDGDGDLDVFIARGDLSQTAGGGIPNLVWINQSR